MDDQNIAPPKRARRRILSCSNCRRLKSRCEYDARANCCQRCNKLRIHCSLQSDAHATRDPRVARSGPSDAPETVDDDRFSNMEDSLASVQASVDKIWQYLQQHSGPSLRPNSELLATGIRQTVGVNLGDEREHDLDTADFPPLHPTQTDTNKSAPIMVVRKFRPSMRRLYEDPARDIITQQILKEDIAEKLVAEFILRLGQGIQVKSVGDLTPAPSIRQASPLLYAVCCLQALRFFKDTNVVNPNDHRQLYEEVRRMLGQVVLASPLPVEELYAILIMCIYEAAPKPVFEYIESWHLSGICAQQAISTIDFAEILSRLSLGKHEARDKTYLSLWNNICLVNLRFAVGTGKPATIPHDLLEHCPAILNHPQATIDDGIVLAEILLFSALCDKTAPPSLDRHGHCQALMAWEKRWAHLLTSQKAIYLRFGREFAYLVLAMRSVEKYGSSRTGQSTFQANHSSQYELSESMDDGGNPDSHLSFNASRTCAHKHALAMARIFLEMPTALVEELPKFHQICIAYCSIVLSGCTDKSASPRQVFDILGDVCAHYRRFSDELPAVMNIALEKMGLELGQNTSGKRDGQSHGSYGLKGDATDAGTEISNDGSASPLTDTRQSHLGGAGNATGADQLDTDWFDHELGLLSFPTVDDFFESWTVQYSGE